ncbi:MAG: GGDEF domain-containing protein, partial [bacterium]|nr:GGDEF domain-containing protein [bacterium]
VGTEVLKEVAGVLREQVRKVDLLSRFGGDEFVIVLLQAPAEKALEVCSRIKTAISDHIFLADKHLNLKITGCFGISSFPENGKTVDQLIKKADLAMYTVKRTGKNGINIYEEKRK